MGGVQRGTISECLYRKVYFQQSGGKVDEISSRNYIVEVAGSILCLLATHKPALQTSAMYMHYFA